MSSMRKFDKPRNGTIAALDVGSSKVCCFIARNDSGVLRVIGIGHQVSKGMRGGAIVDMDQAETSILGAVQAAEDMAQDTIGQVLINLSAGNPRSSLISVEVPTGGHEIGDADLRRVLAQGPVSSSPSDDELIHAIPVGYRVDDTGGVRDPRGMHGERLGANMHMIAAGRGAVRNLMTCVERCHLDVEAVVASAYASGMACLVEDETDLGATLIDIGGGTTQIAVFFDGSLIHIDGIPLGGAHVTSDIARGLSTPLVHAERLKTLYGHAISASADEREVIDVPPIGEVEASQANHVPRSALVRIIQPRLEEIFEMVRARLERGGHDKSAGRRVVLTGGASQMPGVRELAGMVLDKQVRIGRPLRIAGLAEATGGPAFSTCAGLLTYAARCQFEAPLERTPAIIEGNGVMSRLGHWLRDNL